MSVLNIQNNKNFITNKLFLDGNVGISRFDIQKYPWIEKLTQQQIGFFWVPSEIDLTKDHMDFKHLSDVEKHIFTSNIKRQILLDSIQGRAPALAFLPICSLPELENWVQLWSFNETIHSRSYTHIIRNVYADPSVIFDDIPHITEILECSNDISKYYDELLFWNKDYNINSTVEPSKAYKTALWLALVSVNILEGIRFYASFACSFAFGETKKMEGNANIIKLINRDENVHLAFTQQLIKTLPKDDPDFELIKEETKEQCIQMFLSCIEQEKKWAGYLFKDGSIIGLNEKLLCDYLEWIGDKRMKSIGLKSPFKVGSNPLPWTSRWQGGSDVQVAPQQVNLTSYIVGGVKQDVDEDTFKGFSL